jgi:hypothetical protein
MTNREQEEWERGFAHGDIPRRPEEDASEAYMEGYWAAFSGPQVPKERSLEERLAEWRSQRPRRNERGHAI